jgi:phytanoyl-CoA hydroxylase
MPATHTPMADPAEMYRTHHIHTPLPSLDAVDDDAIDAFRRDGFIAVANAFDPAEVQGYRDAITAAVEADDDGKVARRVVHYEAGTDRPTMAALPMPERELAVRKLFTFKDDLPDLVAAAYHPALRDTCERLLGEPVRLVQEMALLKPPGGGAEKPWHQDTAYFRLNNPEAVIGTWTALDDADPENGCMHVVPGSHRAGPKPHYHDRDCQLPDDTIEMDQIVAVPLKPGGAMFFSGLLHHGTPPNRSSRRRRALQFHYLGESGMMTEDPAILTSLFHDRRGYAGCQGWDDIRLAQRPIHLRADF